MAARATRLSVVAIAAFAALGATAQADIIVQQNFDTTTGQGGGTFLVGPGFAQLANWDDGITGEYSFAGTTGATRFGAAAAFGTTNGGVSASGAGVIDVTGVNFNIVDESFETVNGIGGGIFLAGDGTPNTSGSTTDWDDGIAGEAAFAGTTESAAIQTGGGASATGLTTGGMGGGGGGRLAMSNVTVGSGHWYAGANWAMGPLPGAAPFYNTSFESGLEHWTHSGSVYAEPTSGILPMTPHSGDHVLKMFGTFHGDSLAYQAVTAQAGQVWSLSAFAGHVSGDSLVGTQNYVTMAIEFRDASGALLDSGEITILNASSPTDTWTATAPLQRTAPSGTVSAQAVFVFHQYLYQGGAGLMDDVTFEFVSGPSGVDLSQHALTANVQGAVNGTGSVLGDYQLRIEDDAGNRLMFRAQANGSWQSIGGSLDTATEADPNGTPASGVFNVNSSSFQVVIAFDDQYTHRWGTGGTLTFDNVRLTNSVTMGSAWYAGLYWPYLPIANPDLDELRLTADVLGSVPGGKYELRVEAKRDAISTLDEDFNAVLGDCGAGGDCVLLDANDVDGGASFGLTTDFDTGVAGEEAYGGVYGGTFFYNVVPNGISARGLTTGGTVGSGGAEIRVENIILGGGDSGWYGGLQWPGKHLASADLSQVTLEADIKGEIATYGYLGDFEMRIEDGDGDRLYFAGTATGDWQHIGGPLSTATLGPSLKGNGNGVFDLDSVSYNVVIAFANEADTWMWGGVLAVDNLYMTPANTQRDLGHISFTGTANGNWQTIGGALSSGASTFTEFDEHFDTVTGEGGGEFYASGGEVGFGGMPWDTGITGETTFAGTWGSGTMATESAWGCTNCGVGGSGAGNISVTGVGGGASGGWWAGLDWADIAPPLWDDPNQVFCTAQVNASKLAPDKLRVEDGSSPDSNRIYLGWLHTPTTTDFETVGGSLATAEWGCPSPPCGAFNYNADHYIVVLVFYGDTWNTAWDTGGQLTIDNLHFTQVGFGDADNYTVTVTFDDEVATWGDHGRLTVDNLSLGTSPTACAGDCNCDGQVDFADINGFVDAIVSHTYCDGTGENADVNGNGSVGFEDINPFVELLTTHPLPIPCD